MRARPQREAATIARKRVEDAYILYPFEQAPDSDSDASSPRLRAPPPSPVFSDDSGDDDGFVDESESDFPRQSKAALVKKKKRKRSKSPMIGREEGRKFKAGKVEMDDWEADVGATGFMVNSGSVMKNILLGKAGRASRESLSEYERVREGSQHHCVRRAGLSDMSPDTGSYMSGSRDEVWTKAAEVFPLESSNGVARGPVDGNGYRASRFSEHL